MIGSWKVHISSKTDMTLWIRLLCYVFWQLSFCGRLFLNIFMSLGNTFSVFMPITFSRSAAWDVLIMFPPKCWCDHKKWSKVQWECQSICCLSSDTWLTVFHPSHSFKHLLCFTIIKKLRLPMERWPWGTGKPCDHQGCLPSCPWLKWPMMDDGNETLWNETMELPHRKSSLAFERNGVLVEHIFFSPEWCRRRSPGVSHIDAWKRHLVSNNWVCSKLKTKSQLLEWLWKILPEKAHCSFIPLTLRPDPEWKSLQKRSDCTCGENLYRVPHCKWYENIIYSSKGQIGDSIGPQSEDALQGKQWSFHTTASDKLKGRYHPKSTWTE